MADLTDHAPWAAAAEGVYAGSLKGAMDAVAPYPDMVLDSLTVEWSEAVRFDKDGNAFALTNTQGSTPAKTLAAFRREVKPTLDTP